MGKDRQKDQKKSRAEIKAAMTARRKALKAIAVLAGGGTLAVTGLGVYLQYKDGEKSGSDFPEITKYYPDLASYKVKETGNFTTQLNHASIAWFNLTDTRFDYKTAAVTYSYLEDIANNHLVSSLVTPDNQNLTFEVIPNPPSSRTILFIVPENAPTPPWKSIITNQAVIDKPRGVTYPNYETGLNLTQIRLMANVYPISRTSPEIVDTNEAIINEACNVSVGILAQPATLTDYAKEAFCVSLAKAMTYKQIGAPYTTYTGAINDKNFFVPSGRVPFTKFSEVQYNQLPVLPLVLSK